MFKYIFLVFIVAYFVNGSCPGGCNHHELIYDELKCTPVYRKPNDCCPIKYNCSVLDHNPCDKCVFNGKFYATGQQIPNKETYPSCRVGCSCLKSPFEFKCAVLDCPEWLQEPKPGCHLKYELESCCSIGEVCPPFKDIKCRVGGEIFLEGQFFTPPNQKCVSCVCKEGFNGNFVEPFCRKDTCVNELDHSEKIGMFCAAVYLANSNCCPFEWICPNENDKIMRTKQYTSNKGLQCRYGDKLLNVGDKFVRDGVPCECKVPPFVTCSKKYSQI